ncbi:sialoadhesin-like [Brienomyrus brachyistius]|uniref:sialoadhesin-like n=1 Tax=Brienomyrus brachyistius TaxID=42636 RepID=UPI0020B1FD1D|nr:sialoadhesin-like [Brienomyrus brachyistius]
MRMEICQFILPLSCLLLLTATSSVYSQCPVLSRSADMRLVDGGSRCAGIVEVLYCGQWSTVCNRGWGMLDAAEVCRRMSCGDAVATPGRAFFGAGTGWIKPQVCFEGWGPSAYCCGPYVCGGIVYPPCGYHEDAGVICSGALDINCPVSPVCAVTGSTVVIPCEYAYLQSLRVVTFMWCRNDHCEPSTLVCRSDSTNINAHHWGRAECFGDRVKNYALEIKDIKYTDAGVYKLGFTSGYDTQIWVTGPGVTLQVGELKVVMTPSAGSRTLREGESVNLRCDTESCSLSQSKFTWFKDNQPITETTSTLHFSPVCKYHSGKYSCALKDSKVSNKMDLIVQGGAWTVDYPEKTICAVRGSAVVIPCEYHYPKSYSVESMMWSHNTGDCTGNSYVCHSNNINVKSEYRGRAQCLWDKVKNCMLKINDITDTDAGVYRFRFTTNGCEQCGQPGVALRVGELKVVMTSSGGSSALREGDSVNLTCDMESCSPSQSEFTWFKDNQPITETWSTLHFNPVSYHHAGKYSCALKGYRGTLSNPILLLLQSNGNPMTVILVVLGVLLSVLPIIICIIWRTIKLLCNRGGNRGGNKQSCHSDSDNNTYAVIDVRKKSPEYNTLMTAANDRDPARQESHPVYRNMMK